MTGGSVGTIDAPPPGALDRSARPIAHTTYQPLKSTAVVFLLVGRFHENVEGSLGPVMLIH